MGMGCFLSRKQEYPPAKAPAELAACEGKYPPIGIKIPSQATLARIHYGYFVKKSSFLAVFDSDARRERNYWAILRVWPIYHGTTF